MSDDEIRALHAAPMFGHDPAEHEEEEHDASDCYVCACVALADEALARGKAAVIEKMKREATERIAQQMAQEYDALRERVAQLETALRFYADPDTYEQVDILGYCPLSDDTDGEAYGKKARAALAVRKP